MACSERKLATLINKRNDNEKNLNAQRKYSDLIVNNTMDIK